jgi:hypothetical protein
LLRGGEIYDGSDLQYITDQGASRKLKAVKSGVNMGL